MRNSLQDWTIPDPALGFKVVSDRYAAKPWWRIVLEPSWGLAGAATIILVVLAAVASVELGHDTNGFTFRMGWTSGGVAGDARSESARQREAGATVVTPAWRDAAEEAPWLVDLAHLEAEMRRELQVPVAESGLREERGLPDAPWSQDAPLERQQVELLITESERRQQEEFALWFTQFAQEFDVQRRTDQQRMDRDLGALEGYADYLVRVSQR